MIVCVKVRQRVLVGAQQMGSQVAIFGAAQCGWLGCGGGAGLGGAGVGVGGVRSCLSSLGRLVECFVGSHLDRSSKKNLGLFSPDILARLTSLFLLRFFLV